ncbi:hypothetical protein ACXYX3_17180 [Mycobacterium sp. C3-094]
MTRIELSYGLLTVTAIAAGAVATAPAAVARPDDNRVQCQSAAPNSSIVRCTKDGHARIFATPPDVSPPFANMPYEGA